MYVGKNKWVADKINDGGLRRLYPGNAVDQMEFVKQRVQFLTEPRARDDNDELTAISRFYGATFASLPLSRESNPR